MPLTPPRAREKPDVAPIFAEAAGDETDGLVERYTYKAISRKALAFLAVGAFALSLYPGIAPEPPDPLSPYAMADDVKLIGTISTWHSQSLAHYHQKREQYAGQLVRVAGRVVEVLDERRFVIHDSSWRPLKVLVINRIAPVMDRVLEKGDRVIVEGFVSQDRTSEFDAVLHVGPSPSVVP